MTKYLVYRHTLRDSVFYKVSPNMQVRSVTVDGITNLAAIKLDVKLSLDLKNYLKRNKHLCLGQFTDEELENFPQLYPELLL